MTIPNGVTKIEKTAFYECTNLKKVVIPASVSKIADGCFNNTEDVTIYCWKDSAAHQFAEKYSIPYVLLDGEYVDTDSEIDTDSSVDTDSEIDTDTSVDTDSEIDTDTSVDTDSEIDTDSSVDTESDSDTDSSVDTDSDSDTDSETVFGDVDGDGEISAVDAFMVLRASISNPDDEELMKIADVDGDGTITSADALYLLRYSAGFDSPYLP